MDQKILFLINRQWTGPMLDRFMALVSSFDAWVPPLLILVALLIWRGGFRVRAFLLCTVIIVGIDDGIVARNLKHTVDRPRPHQAIEGVRQVDLGKATPRLLAVFKEPRVKLSKPTGEDVEGRSFPSSHTVNTTVVALMAVCFYRRWGWLAFIPSLAVAYSRIYTGSHWPSDVLISIILGLGSGMILFCGLEWLWRKFGGRLLPKVHQNHPSLLSP